MKFPGVTLLVLLVAGEAEALQEPYLCYVLDGILFAYGIILTVLYCRLKSWYLYGFQRTRKLQYRKKAKTAATSPIYEKVEGLYTGLEVEEMQPYSTLETSKPVPKEPPPRISPSVE